MTTYNEIKGDIIEVVPSDPANPGEGDIWYNSTVGVLKGNGFIPGTWASGGTLNTARDTYQGGSRNGTQNASRTFGGYDTANVANNESYNGTAWSEEADVGTGRRGGGGAGTSDAALFMGGINPPATTNTFTEEWNGSSWTAVNNMGTGRNDFGSTGTQTAALVAGAPPYAGTTEEYDGTNWTAGGTMNAGIINGPSCGTQTAALRIGGQSGDGPTATTAVEEYNGTAWTTLSGALPVAKQTGGSAGTISSAITFGGITPPASTTTTTTFGYDGTTWSTKSSMANSKYGWSGGMGTSTSALAVGGNPGTFGGSEEWTESIGTVTIDTN